MNRSEALEKLTGCRVARLATTTPEGGPHVVPITFAITGPWIVTMIDHKPKTTSRLQRLINVESHPWASVLTDQYSEDWSQLWWVRIDGAAEIHDDGKVWESARRALSAKYAQYAERRPDGPAIVVAIESVSSWSSTA